jgi:hypothetical protein
MDQARNSSFAPWSSLQRNYLDLLLNFITSRAMGEPDRHHSSKAMGGPGLLRSSMVMAELDHHRWP